MKPLMSAPRLLEAAIMVVKMAIKVAFFNKGAVAPMYPRPAGKCAVLTDPQKKKMRKIRGIFCVKTKQNTTRAQIKAAMLMGILNPTLSAIHPQEPSPMAMPIILTENIKPNMVGTTPIEVRYRGRIGCRTLIARVPRTMTGITVINSRLINLFI